MRVLIDTYRHTGTIHHAYLIEGSSDVVLPGLISFLKKEMKIETQGNPDFSLSNFETFTIDDGRYLQERQSRKAFQNKKIYILTVGFITVEAQNSLLKVFEEPTEGTHFFIITPTAEILLPTLRSRLIIIPTNEKNENNSLTKAKEFINASAGDRLVMIKGMIEEKDKMIAINFVSDLEKLFSQKKRTEKDVASLEEILKTKKYLYDRSPSIKLLLEHLALVLP